MRRKRILLLLIPLLWCGMFVTDYIRCSHFQHPIFVIPVDTADDGGSGTYLGPGYRVEIEYRDLSLLSINMYFCGELITGVTVLACE